jgi:PilZ domain
MAKLMPRQFERVSHLRTMSVRVLPHGAPRSVHALDLSPSGVRLFSERSIAVGDRVELTWNDRTPAVTVAGRVVYVKADESGLSAGVVFDRPLSDAAFRDLNGRRS